MKIKGLQVGVICSIVISLISLVNSSNAYAQTFVSGQMAEWWDWWDAPAKKVEKVSYSTKPGGTLIIKGMIFGSNNSPITQGYVWFLPCVNKAVSKGGPDKGGIIRLSNYQITNPRAEVSAGQFSLSVSPDFVKGTREFVLEYGIKIPPKGSTDGLKPIVPRFQVPDLNKAIEIYLGTVTVRK